MGYNTSASLSTWPISHEMVRNGPSEPSTFDSDMADIDPSDVSSVTFNFPCTEDEYLCTLDQDVLVLVDMDDCGRLL